ncbi:MAG: hypothetical protein AB1714_01160 [Acidobacteriota bacterium]
MSEHEAAGAFGEAGTIAEVGLEVATAFADEMPADVRGTLGGRAAFCGQACALDRPQGHAQMRLSGGLGELLHGLPVAVPAQKVHVTVRTGRVALQHPLDRAHVFEVLAPVESGAEPEAGDDVRHRDLGCGLPLVRECMVL